MKSLRIVLPSIVLLSSPVFGGDLLPSTKSIAEAVDHYIDVALKEQDLSPAALADDATILRRLTLDLAGRIPTPDEYRNYVGSTEPGKKVAVVDRLLASGGFARHQVNEFDAMLSPSAQGGRRGGSLREYLRLAFQENRSWDTIYRDLLLADEKEPGRKGASQFLKSRIKDVDRLTTDVSILFFGVNISCAQCHDHPLVSDWKQDHYYGMKSFFARTYEAGMFLGERDNGLVQFKTTKNVSKNAQMMFLTGKVVEQPGGAKPVKVKKRQNQGKATTPTMPPPAPSFSARSQLVKLSLEPEQRSFFAKAIVNRVWYRYFGLGLVSPLDQMHSENAASHPELLDWLARDLVEHGYDLKRLIRGLVLSNTYARSSRWAGERFPPAKSFAVARLRALSPMQLATSLRLATANPDAFALSRKPEELDKKFEAIENASTSFAQLIEQPSVDFQIGVNEALLFSNNERIQRDYLSNGSDRLMGRIKDIKDPNSVIDLLYPSILSRNVRAEEKQALLDYIAQRQDRPTEAVRQIIWALLTSAEFRFNH
jgi:hypothetical protein